MHLKENIKYLRKSIKISQTELGTKLNISRAGIAKLESGENNPTFENLIKLKEIFNVSLDDLVYKDLSKTNERN